MRVLVIGSTGFVGRHLVDALKRNGHSVYPFSRSIGYDICLERSFNDFLDKKIDVVFNLAGDGYVPDSWDKPESSYMINAIGTQHALDFCKKTGSKLVYVSSYIYGIPEYLPIDEDHPISPNNPYAHSKRLGEEICRFYARELGLNIIILRPFNIYGEGQRECFLIPSLIKQIREKKSVVVKDEAPRRDYLYVSDFVDACLLAMGYCREGIGIYNVGFGMSFSVKEIIGIVAEFYGGKISWSSLGERRINEIPDTVADCRRINGAMGWEPKVSFKEGIKKMAYSTSAYNIK